MPDDRPRTFRIGESVYTLQGPRIRVGSAAPGFTVIATDFRPITLDTWRDRTRVLLSFPSLDTSVCDREAREFSKRVSGLESVETIAVSVDLPFAQKRWCGASGVTNLTLGSDHRELSFGNAYGVVVPEQRQLSRAAFVVDPDGQVTYAEYVPDIVGLPDFDAVIRAAKEAAGSA